MNALEEKAKDAAVYYGLQSPEYAEAVREMNAAWVNSKRSFLDRVINLHLKLYSKWQKKPLL